MKNKVTEGFFAASLIFISLVLLSFTYTGNRATIDTFDPISESSKMNFTESNDFNGISFEAYKDTIKKKVKKRVKKIDNLPDELETVIEVALTEDNDSIATSILIEIDDALNKIEWKEINKELEEAKIEIKIAQEELDHLNIDSVIKSAMKEAEYDINVDINDSCKKVKVIRINEGMSEKEAVEIAQQALKTAKISIEAINLDSIIEISLSQGLKALDYMEIDKIVEDALKGVKIEISTGKDTNSQSFKEQQKKLEELEEELDELEKAK